MKRLLTLTLVAIALTGCDDLFFELSLAQGDACVTGEQCESGFCVDGVCCDVECNNSFCAACSAEKNGQQDGSCLPIPFGEDPDNECPGLFACGGNFGSCQDCSDYPDFTLCEDGWCFDGTCRREVCTTVTCNIASPGFVLGDTNQRDCFDSEGSQIPCDSCEPLCGQDAQFGWDTEFTSTDRFARTADPEPVITDNATGLEWRGCVQGLTGSDCSSGSETTLRWDDAHRGCTRDDWAGGGWRLPDVYELQSIVDLGTETPPRADPQGFPGLPSLPVWTATVALDGVFVVDFSDGAFRSLPTGNPSGLLCVRGGRAPIDEPRWQNNFAELASDLRTGLDWERDPDPTPVTWSAALAYCNALDIGGNSAWRLPSRVELASIVDVSQRGIAIDRGIFPGAQADVYWSSTSDSEIPNNAWSIDFTQGQTADFDKGELQLVRCVRTR